MMKVHDAILKALLAGPLTRRSIARTWWRAMMRRIGYYTWQSVEVWIDGERLEGVTQITWRPN